MIDGGIAREKIKRCRIPGIRSLSVLEHGVPTQVVPQGSCSLTIPRRIMPIEPGYSQQKCSLLKPTLSTRLIHHRSLEYGYISTIFQTIYVSSILHHKTIQEVTLPLTRCHQPPACVFLHDISTTYLCIVIEPVLVETTNNVAHISANLMER